jgi:hypothetical protein
LPRSAQSYFAFRLGELAAFQKASYAVAYVLRASDAFPQLLGFPLNGGHLGDAPQPLRCCEVLALALRTGASETRPYQSFSPKSSIALAASEDDVKDHAPQDVSLGTPLLYQKTLRVER